MDTDDLSEDAYKAILVESEKFNHDLTLQFGLLSSQCANEEEYLNASESMIKDWLENWDEMDIVDNIFFGNFIDFNDFRTAVQKILKNIARVREIPLEEREFDLW